MAFDIPDIWTDIDNQFRTTRQGGLKEISNQDVIIQSIENIVLTIPGERPMRPSFCSKALRLMWQNISRDNAVLLGNYIQSALKTWEPRFKLEQISVIPNYNNGGSYTVRLSGSIPTLDAYIHFERILVYTQ